MILISKGLILLQWLPPEFKSSKGEDWKHAVPEIIREKEIVTPPSVRQNGRTPSVSGGGQASPSASLWRPKGGGAIIVSAWYQYRPFAYYYNREYFRDYENTIELLKKDNIHCIDKADGLSKINLVNFSKIILVQSHRPVADPENTVFAYFSQNFSLQKSEEYEGIRVSVFGKE